MKGSIRFIAGLLVVYAAAGTLDTATDAQLAPVMLVAAVGIALMYSGVRAINGRGC